MINWKQKLSSRKLWALATALIVSIATALGAGSGTVEHITAIIGSLGACMVYMFSEAWVDSYRVNGKDDGSK